MQLKAILGTSRHLLTKTMIKIKTKIMTKTLTDIMIMTKMIVDYCDVFTPSLLST